MTDITPRNKKNTPRIKNINRKRTNFLNKNVHPNTIRHGGIGLCEYLLNPYILNIRTRIRTNHLSLFRISPKRQERLDDIYRLHKEGKSTQEITDFMNQKYGTTLRTNRPYYPQLIWVSMDKYKKHKKRLLDYEETIEEVYFDYIDIKKTKLPKEFIMSNFL